MRRLAMAILLTLLAASAAWAVDPADLGLVKTGDQVMSWSRVPMAAQMDRAFPAQATSSGHVVLRCGVTEQGALKHCAVVSEAPLGFAAAAMGLTKDFAVWTNGFTRKQVEDASVDLPFDFRPGQGDAAAQRVDPIWLKLPEPADMVRNFPQAAANAGLKTGLGVVSCTATDYGALTGCTVAREDPAGSGFGAAALSLAENKMMMSRWSRQGRPVGGARLQIPIRLTLTADAVPPSGEVKVVNSGAWTPAQGTAGPYTPERACRMAVPKGLVVMDCKVGFDGALSACAVVADAPPDFGFGDAAMKMAQRHMLIASPVLVDGKPVANHVVRLSLPFTVTREGCSPRGVH
jgi:hypothetical protein